MKTVKFSDYLKEEQKTWGLLDWLDWYWTLLYLGIKIRWGQFKYKRSLNISYKNNSGTKDSEVYFG